MYSLNGRGSLNFFVHHAALDPRPDIRKGITVMRHHNRRFGICPVVPVNNKFAAVVALSR